MSALPLLIWASAGLVACAWLLWTTDKLLKAEHKLVHTWVLRKWKRRNATAWTVLTIWWVLSLLLLTGVDGIHSANL